MSNTSDGRDLGLREVKVALDRAVRELRVCGEGIRWSSATILQSCNTPGTKSMAHRNMLADKAKSLENVAALCSMMAGRLTEYGQKLDGDRPEAEVLEVLKELLGVSQSLGDQVCSEERDAKCILSVLRSGRAGASSVV